MKNSLFVLAAFLATVSIATAQGGADYWPLNVGNHWVTMDDLSTCENPDPSNIGNRFEVEGTDSILGQEFFRVKFQNIREDSSLGGAFYLWMGEDSTGFVVVAAGDTSIVDSAIIIDPPFLFVPNEIQVGLSWESYNPLEDKVVTSSIESLSETVQVPAGVFDNCLMIQAVNTDPQTGDTIRIFLNYFARDVGMVLETRTFPFTCRRELVEYFVITAIDEEGTGNQPARFHLSQNYPNPFNPETVIEYALPELSDISVVIYNLRGQEVRRWDILFQSAGYHTIRWNGTTALGNPVPSGVYLYRLQAGDFVLTRKMVLLK